MRHVWFRQTAGFVAGLAVAHAAGHAAVRADELPAYLLPPPGRSATAEPPSAPAPRLPDYESIDLPSREPPTRPPGPAYEPALDYLPDFVAPSTPAGPPACGVPGVWWAEAELLGWAVGGGPDDQLRPGFRLTTGFWLAPAARTVGVEGSFFVLGDESGTFTGVVTDSSMGGAEANVRLALACGPGWRLDALAGYRYLSLREGLTGPEVTARVANDYHGGQIGLVGGQRFGRLSVDGFGKVGIGAVFTTGAGTGEEFAVVPEAGVRVGYAVTERLRVSAAYNFLYLSDSPRPGDPSDGSPTGVAAWRDADVWVQGISGGLEVRY